MTVAFAECPLSRGLCLSVSPGTRLGTGPRFCSSGPCSRPPGDGSRASTQEAGGAAGAQVCQHRTQLRPLLTAPTPHPTPTCPSPAAPGSGPTSRAKLRPQDLSASRTPTPLSDSLPLSRPCVPGGGSLLGRGPRCDCPPRPPSPAGCWALAASPPTCIRSRVLTRLALAFAGNTRIYTCHLLSRLRDQRWQDDSALKTFSKIAPCDERHSVSFVP